MDREAQRLGETPHLVDEPRLADARLAAHIDGLSRERRHARARDAPELFELRLAADEEAAAAADVRAFSFDAGEAPHAHGRIDALEAQVAERVGADGFAERTMHAVRDQRLAGAGGIDEPRGEIHGIADHGVVVEARAALRARDDLAARDADVR